MNAQYFGEGIDSLTHRVLKDVMDDNQGTFEGSKPDGHRPVPGPNGSTAVLHRLGSLGLLQDIGIETLQGRGTR